eukprot:14494327-Ditylum_brightwellii.AAC.1
MGDQSIWANAHTKEYFGLHANTKTWEYITEKEYQKLCPIVGTALPTMAIARVEKNEKGKLKRAKYRICVLENLDPHDWTKL